MDWLDLGYFGLFVSTFLSATLIPMSSEAVLVAMLTGPFNPIACLVIATLGNWIGGLTSYGLGYLGDWHRMHRWLRVDQSKVMGWKDRVVKYGSLLAALCWLPFIGDLLAVALGVFRVNMVRVGLWMLLGKFLRYFVIFQLWMYWSR